MADNEENDLRLFLKLFGGLMHRRMNFLMNQTSLSTTRERLLVLNIRAYTEKTLRSHLAVNCYHRRKFIGDWWRGHMRYFSSFLIDSSCLM